MQVLQLIDQIVHTVVHIDVVNRIRNRYAPSLVKKIDQLHHVITKYIYNLEDFQNYYICLRDDIDENKDEFRSHSHSGSRTMSAAPAQAAQISLPRHHRFDRGYTDRMHVRVAVRNRGDMGAVDIPFDRHTLLPTEFIDDSNHTKSGIPLMVTMYIIDRF